MHPEKTRVLLFCGGRGSKTLIDELLRHTDIDLTLMVNAYDDGLSTGALRKFIPGMLGPSDFRKNLSYLLDLYSPEQYALQKLVEYRLPLDFSPQDLAAFRHFATMGDDTALKAPLRDLFTALGNKKAKSIRAYLQTFFAYYDAHPEASSFEFADCSVGNLAFAGIYLSVGKNFNRTIEALAQLADVQAHLVNVSRGEGYTLVGIKQDGELLVSEGQIVGAQSASPITDTFFITATPDEGWESLQQKPVTEKLAWLRAHELHPEISPEATQALAQADIIIYGAGTQHSSLLPSYRIAHQAIKDSPAKVKAFVVNLGHDHDIAGLSAADLVNKGLFYLKDDDNSHKTITHIMYHDAPVLKDSVAFTHDVVTAGTYRGAQIVCGNYANPTKQNAHNGYAAIKSVLNQSEEATLGGKPALDIYVDLVNRIAASHALIQEAIELGWERSFSSVTLHIPEAAMDNIPALPASFHVVPFANNQKTLESLALSTWVTQDKRNNYLATLTGDGEYRLKDLQRALELLRTTSFAVVLGSRTQSRRQFIKSLRAAYGEGGFMYRLSWLGAFVLTALFGLRFGVVFSDPLTGFRVYRRDRISAFLQDALKNKKLPTSVAITRLLLKHNTEIAEIPVKYKTFSGFTHAGWRFQRGIKSLWSFFG